MTSANSSVLPGDDRDLQDAQQVAELFTQAAQSLTSDPRRRGACVHLPAAGRLLMTGDLHDNGYNFLRIINAAQLHQSPTNYLILHEIVHGDALVNGCDLSVRTLARVAALRLAYPDQVFILLGNHELAQMNHEDILKAGSSVVGRFDDGLDMLYSDDADLVADAMNQFIRAMLLAVRCENGVFCSHSLPAPRKLETFDPAVLERDPTDADLASGGSAWLMVWGRHHNQRVEAELAAKWGAQVFLMGHQPAEMGWETEAETMLILASDHNHGVVLPVDLSRPWTRDELIDQVRPIAGIKA